MQPGAMCSKGSQHMTSGPVTQTLLRRDRPNRMSPFTRLYQMWYLIFDNSRNYSHRPLEHVNNISSMISYHLRRLFGNLEFRQRVIL